MSTEVYVFADWEDFGKPTLVGTLRSSVIKNKEHFSFSYDEAWLQSSFAQKIDPDLDLYSGEQHNADPRSFRTFLDSCPDRWGRLLMKRREAIVARQEERRPKVLNEIDYLLGVHDLYRLGALRFKQDMDGPFLDDDEKLAAPPISSLRDLEYAVQHVEDNGNADDPVYLKWLYMLMSPGSSLGGARPKASVVDEQEHLWIAKFPSRHDDYDIAAWEFVVYQLALDAGVQMSECRIDRFNSHHHTFLTKRFDRTEQSRLHFTSAMTQLGYYDGEYDASYLELAQFLTDHGSNTKTDLAQLWRRIVFNIAVSNTDDHLRNHGFIYQDGGWVLSPAYDINPVTPANGLHLSISDDDNSLDYGLAMEVIDFFQLNAVEAQTIKDKVLASVRRWGKVATRVGISRSEQKLMAPAFNV
ncbi:type II toxin-antitoxin system HipA family toxin [Pseudomaricurvus alkylphenolicus]|uniref:type II toxin-antitoxin system HipA family toxin n=1 Tax=Pseudomaricurvus alkylphenolicus TaxID=1306991 RepID=UPI00141F67C6|nr:HipA domain-containing protein [Pseudomaricurvus alkylphenolicus]NIB39093.1 type II toxin-antitoxin system HipA family toxin [Pseudomaricurvus alkylphenolicus]